MQEPSLDELKETAELVLTSRTPSQPEVMRLTADMLLSSAELLASLSKTDRWKLCQILFPYFTLPSGWREVAERGGLSPQDIGALISARVRAIRSPSDALREIEFLRQLTSKASRAQLAYTPLLIPHIESIIEVIREYAPEEIRNAIRPYITKWRLAARGWLREKLPPNKW